MLCGFGMILQSISQIHKYQIKFLRFVSVTQIFNVVTVVVLMGRQLSEKMKSQKEKKISRAVKVLLAKLSVTGRFISLLNPEDKAFNTIGVHTKKKEMRSIKQNL
jgi:hypothetical protein